MQVYKCTWCGERLSEDGDTRQPRSDKKFCCSQHRVKFHRWMKNIEKRHLEAVRAIDELGRYMDFPQSRELAARRLADVKNTVNFVMSDAGIKAVK